MIPEGTCMVCGAPTPLGKNGERRKTCSDICYRQVRVRGIADEDVSCPECGRMFKARRLLGIHRRAEHQIPGHMAQATAQREKVRRELKAQLPSFLPDEATEPEVYDLSLRYLKHLLTTDDPEVTVAQRLTAANVGIRVGSRIGEGSGEKVKHEVDRLISSIFGDDPPVPAPQSAGS